MIFCLKNATSFIPRFPICVRRYSSDFIKASPYRVIFFGTDDFALESLKMLYMELQKENLIDHLSVVCAHTYCSVAKFVNQNKIPLLKWKPSVEEIKEIEPHIGLVASFGHLIPANIINSFPYGMINVHASLLPRWRGAAPIVHAIMHRDTVTGITIMKIKPFRFDEGEILSKKTCQFEENENTLSLTKKLSILGANELYNCIYNLPRILKCAEPQSNIGVTYAPKMNRDMAKCDWNNLSSHDLFARHLALHHVYPLYTQWRDKIIKIIECNVSSIPLENSDMPGSFSFNWKNRHLIVSCSSNTSLVISKLKLPNKHAISAIDFYNGYLKRIADNKELWKFV